MRAIGSKPPWKAGIVLITEAPWAWTRTHGPALVNMASVPFGLSAPTEITGARVGEGFSGPLPSLHGANAAGNIGRAVASLPAEHTTTVPQSPSSPRMSYIVGSNSASSGVSW